MYLSLSWYVSLSIVIKIKLNDKNKVPHISLAANLEQNDHSFLETSQTFYSQSTEK